MNQDCNDQSCMYEIKSKSKAKCETSKAGIAQKEKKRGNYFKLKVA